MSTEAGEAGSPANSREASRKRRFRSCVIAFAVLALPVVGIPVGIGLTDYLRRRSEAEFVDILHRYDRAQSVYHSKDRDGDKKLEYCRRIGDLVGIEKSGGAGIADDELLVTEELAAARGRKGKPLRGYLFLEMSSIWKIPVNWEGDYAICAIPAEYGRTGTRTYIMKADGEVWWKDRGKAEFLRNYPRDREGNGWALFEKKKDQ